MRAIEIAHPGGPDVLRLAERPVPDFGHGEVLIRVAAAGINRPDVVQREGNYAPPPGVTDIPGLEVAGVVEAVGRDVERLAVGDRVCALLGGGGYAEYATTAEGHCLPIPEGWSMIEAASIPETALTVWANLVDSARMAAGETVLIHGGSSGIGVFAIQMVKALGGRAYATAGSPAKVDACLALGAERCIDYKTEDFVEALGRDSVDVVLDMVGGDYLMRNQKILRQDGRIVMIGIMGGGRPPIDLWTMMRKRQRLTGSVLRARSTDEKAAIARAAEKQLWPLLTDRTICPVIDTVFPLEDAAAAHRMMEGSGHVGKIMLAVDA